jgi:hypothetical protein
MSPNFVDIFTEHPGPKETGVHDSVFQPERRKRTRTSVHWPVRLLRDRAAKSIGTVTQNLSSSGFYCLSPAPLTPGELLICILTLPTYDPRSEERRVSLECQALVIRAEAIPDGSFGIACHIEDYHLVPTGLSIP